MTTKTYSTTADDCHATIAGPLDTTNTVLSICGNITYSNADTRTWIPFVVDMPKNMIIISATLRWVATDTRSESIDMGVECEAADNASVPADRAALYAKAVIGTGYTYTLAPYTTGVEYSYICTVVVQAVLNRSGWVSGNTMAIVIDDLSATGSQRREVAAFENATYAEPKLDIVFNYIPKGGGLI